MDLPISATADGPLGQLVNGNLLRLWRIHGEGR